MKAWMIAECVGESIYEAHTLPFVYLDKEWAEFQKSILEQEIQLGIHYKIREVILVDKGPE